MENEIVPSVNLKSHKERVIDWVNKTTNIITILLMIAALFLTTVSVKQSSQAVQISNESLNLSRKTLDMQRKEFFLKNRPFVALKNMRFGQVAESKSGKESSHSILLETFNISSIPATNFRNTVCFFLNGKQLGKSTCENIEESSLLCNQPFTIHAAIKDELYAQFILPNNDFVVLVETTYSGMLSEVPNAYKTIGKYRYSHSEGNFSVIEHSIK